MTIEVEAPFTPNQIIDALERHYPSIRGTIRDPQSGKRRPFLRFYACREDISHRSMDDLVPSPIASGEEVFLIIGAISGG